MPERDLGRYQMLWDCPFCGAGGLLGLDHRHCPGCGAPQDPARRYFPPEGAEIAVEDHPFHGADRVCPACATPNAAIAAFCTSCGSPLDAAEAARRRRDQRAAEGAALPADDAAAAAAEHDAVAADERARRLAAAGGAVEPQDEPAPRGKRGCLVPGVVLAALLLILACVGVCAWRSEARVTVTGHTWERSVAVEALGTVRDSAWDEEVPAGARGVRCQRAQRGTEQVADGETCTTVRKDNGDGTFSKVEECRTRYRDEPVYDDKCTYEIDKWMTARTEVASGGLADKPAWPPVKLAGGEREGARKEAYVVRFATTEGEELTCSTSQQRWSALPVGSAWKARIGLVGSAIDCDALEPG